MGIRDFFDNLDEFFDDISDWASEVRNSILRVRTQVFIHKVKEIKEAEPASRDATSISTRGIDMIRKHEGLRLKAYMPTPNDVPTIGYGHTKDVRMGDVITKAQAVEFLKQDVAWVEKALNRYVNVPLNQNQYDALASFTYNLGARNLLKSTLLRVLNQGKYDEVPTQLMRWNKQKGKVLRGLTKRRREEAELFMS